MKKKDSRCGPFRPLTYPLLFFMTRRVNNRLRNAGLYVAAVAISDRNRPRLSSYRPIAKRPTSTLRYKRLLIEPVHGDKTGIARRLISPMRYRPSEFENDGKPGRRQPGPQGSAEACSLTTTSIFAVQPQAVSRRLASRPSAACSSRCSARWVFFLWRRAQERGNSGDELRKSKPVVQIGAPDPVNLVIVAGIERRQASNSLRS